MRPALPVYLWIVAALGLVFVGPSGAQVEGSPSGSARQELGHPGYLIMSAARDSSSGYTWLSGPGPGQISLSWRDGMLTLPDTLVLEPFGEDDLAIPVTAGLTGAGISGNVRWLDGSFEISEPVLITDGVINLLVSKGELEVVETRIRYRPRPPAADKPRADPRASFMMLAGILLLILVLMRRARNRLRGGS